MKTFLLAGIVVCVLASARAVTLPTGDPKDFSIKPCLHSISYAGVWRGQAKLTVDEFLVKAKELGFEAVMLMAKRPHVSPLDYDETARKQLRARMDQLGLKLVCLAGYSDFTAGSDKPGIPNVEIQAAYLGQVARLARDLGTDTVRVFTGYERPNIPFDQQYAMVLEGLRLSAKEAAKYNVTLAVQNHHDIAIHHDMMFWLLKEVNQPNVVAAFDAWAPTLQNLTSDQLRQAVFKMKPYIAHTTVADYVRLPRFHYDNTLTNYLPEDTLIRAVAAGDGIIDYDTFFRSLRQIGYRGYVGYEMCEVLDGGGSIDNLDRTAKRFLEFFQKYDKPADPSSK
jgi:sugar phosphate isomerase/epimerase